MSFFKYLATTAVAVSLCSCSLLEQTKEDDKDTVTDVKTDTITIKDGTILEPKDNPWILGSDETLMGNLTIKSGATVSFDGTLTVENGTLTIDSGAVLKFKEGEYLRIGTEGKIIVNGTKTKPVLFTTAQAGKYWGYNITSENAGGIYIENDATTGNVITGAIIESAKTGIVCERADGLTLTNSILRNNLQYGAVFFENSLVLASGDSALGNATNDILVKDGVAPNIDATNFLAKGIEIPHGITESAGTLSPYTYWLDGIYNITGTGEAVTFSAGASFKLKESAYISVHTGGLLKVAGTAEKQVHIGSAEAGKYFGYNVTGDNAGALYFDESSATGNSIDYAVIDSAKIGVYSERVDGVSITNTMIKNCRDWGASFEKNSLVSLKNVTATGNKNNDILAKSDVVSKIDALNSFEKGIEVKDAIDNGATLSAHTYWIDDSYRIETAPCIINAGAVLKFKESAYLDIGTGADLQVVGTTEKPVLFTSAEAGKYWGYNVTGEDAGGIIIQTDASIGSSIDNAIIENAKIGIYTEELLSAVSITNTTVKNCRDWGLSLGKNSLALLKNVTATGNKKMDILAKSNIVSYIDSLNSFEKGIEIKDAIDEGAMLTDHTYLIDDSYQIIGASCLINAGAILKFKESAYLDIGTGANLKVMGTASQPVTFASADAGKFWGYNVTGKDAGGIIFEDDASGDNSIEYAVITTPKVGVYTELLDAVTIKNSKITDYSLYGISLPKGSDATLVSNNTISSTKTTAKGAIFIIE